jgi:hypothetical protein
VSRSTIFAYSTGALVCLSMILPEMVPGFFVWEKSRMGKRSTRERIRNDRFISEWSRVLSCKDSQLKEME